ncbi:unnamed protein product [Rotaria socialis]|uniref:SH3 domain-containing protein n=1 Tax=Rotaria socialis TaxID=392032 RepID=A0A820Z932_9BILA|nr:unnamed protein product [Rotaria socialis]CAF4561313.1 unnamed protein product [Rotaria socialis]
MHGSEIEYFTIVDDVANTWITSLDRIFNRQSSDVDENRSESDDDRSIPKRLPPRPENSVSLDKIYVCLYNHDATTTEDSHELEFQCGDLLYIINTDGPNVYVGFKYEIRPSTDKTPRIGLAFKDYITPVFEKI